MCAVELPGALADPQHVGRAVVPAASERVLTGQRFLVAEEQRLVTRVDVDFVQAAVRLGVDAAGPHEAQGAIDLGGELLVLLTLRAAGDELLRPRMDPVRGRRNRPW